MYALVDCNNFFVSCERVFQPELEGKAVVVLSNNDGCVVARSNESKAMGIKMGTPFFQLKHYVDAGRLEVRSSNYSLYGDLSARVMSILADAAPRIEVYSIDEAFMLMDGIDEEKLPEICRDVVRKVRRWVGIPVSVGIAPTKTLAKIASHFAKRYKGYRGVCMIDTEEKRRKALSLTPIGDVWGVGRRLAPKLESRGVHTALDLTQRNGEWIESNFSVSLLRTCMELQGKPALAEDNSETRKTICTSRSFADMIVDERELSLRVSDFAAKCAQKLREEGTAAYEVTTFMYTNRFREDLDQYFPSATVRLPMAASSAQEIVGAALRALRIIYRPGFRYKKAGVVVSHIVDAAAIQGVMFGVDEALREKQDRLSKVIDMVNASDDGLLRLATQRPGHYAEGIRRDHCSPRYTTEWNELLEIH